MSRKMTLKHSTIEHLKETGQLNISEESLVFLGTFVLTENKGDFYGGGFELDERWSSADNQTPKGICRGCFDSGWWSFSARDPENNLLIVETDNECFVCPALKHVKELLPPKLQWLNYRNLNPTNEVPVPIELQQQMIDQIRRGELDGHSILWSGPSRAGKTVLASALLHSMVERYLSEGFWKRFGGGYGLPIHRVNTDRWLAQHHAYETHNWESSSGKPPQPEPNIRTVLQISMGPDTPHWEVHECPSEFPPVLVLEEIDKWTPTDFKLNALFTVINAAAEAGGMIISTSNLPVDEFRRKYPDWFYRRLVESNVDSQIRLWFANNTSETKPCPFSFLAARLRSAMPSATAGNNVTWPSLWRCLTCS